MACLRRDGAPPPRIAAVAVRPRCGRVAEYREIEIQRRPHQQAAGNRFGDRIHQGRQSRVAIDVEGHQGVAFGRELEEQRIQQRGGGDGGVGDRLERQQRRQSATAPPLPSAAICSRMRRVSWYI